MLNRPLMLQVNFLVFVEMYNTENAVAGQEGYYNQGNMSTISSFCFKVWLAWIVNTYKDHHLPHDLGWLFCSANHLLKLQKNIAKSTSYFNNKVTLFKLLWLPCIWQCGFTHLCLTKTKAGEVWWPCGQCTRLQIKWSRFKSTGKLCCVLGQDTLLSQCLSPPRCRMNLMLEYLVLSTGLRMWIGHCKEIQKLTFQVLALPPPQHHSYFRNMPHLLTLELHPARGVAIFLVHWNQRKALAWCSTWLLCRLYPLLQNLRHILHNITLKKIIVHFNTKIKARQ